MQWLPDNFTNAHKITDLVFRNIFLLIMEAHPAIVNSSN